MDVYKENLTKEIKFTNSWIRIRFSRCRTADLDPDPHHNVADTQHRFYTC